MKCVANYFCVIPPNQGFHKSSADISSNNSKITNHISLTETDNLLYSFLKILRWKKIARKSTNKLYFWYSLGL